LAKIAAPFTACFGAAMAPAAPLVARASDLAQPYYGMTCGGGLARAARKTSFVRSFRKRFVASLDLSCVDIAHVADVADAALVCQFGLSIGWASTCAFCAALRCRSR
jgi:hypothetical protein